MSKLVLYKLHQGVYPELDGNIHYACAYLYYGTKYKPTDQHGMAIGMFYQNPFELEKHLRNSVLPSINEGLKESAYTATDIDFLNQSPHPYVVIKHKENKVISDTDLRQIRKSLLAITKNISFANQPSHLFHRYDLRDRKPAPVDETKRHGLNNR